MSPKIALSSLTCSLISTYIFFVRIKFRKYDIVQLTPISSQSTIYAALNDWNFTTLTFNFLFYFFGTKNLFLFFSHSFFYKFLILFQFRDCSCAWNVQVTDKFHKKSFFCYFFLHFSRLRPVPR